MELGSKSIFVGKHTWICKSTPRSETLDKQRGFVELCPMNVQTISFYGAGIILMILSLTRPAETLAGQIIDGNQTHFPALGCMTYYSVLTYNSIINHIHEFRVSLRHTLHLANLTRTSLANAKHSMVDVSYIHMKGTLQPLYNVEYTEELVYLSRHFYLHIKYKIMTTTKKTLHVKKT